MATLLWTKGQKKAKGREKPDFFSASRLCGLSPGLGVVVDCSNLSHYHPWQLDFERQRGEVLGKKYFAEAPTQRVKRKSFLI